MKVFVAIFVMVALSGCGTMMDAGGHCTVDESLPMAQQADFQLSCEGNNQASLRLGRYYEARAEASQNNDDYRTAAHFYRKAAAGSSGQTFIYIPGAGDVQGYVMPVQTGPRTFGLAEAEFRLAKLYQLGLGVKMDQKASLRLYRAAANGGYKQACLALEALGAEVPEECKLGNGP